MRRAWLALAAVYLLSLAACDDSESSPDAEQALRKSSAGVRDFEAKLKKMAATTGEQKPCPDGRLRATVQRSKNRRALFVDSRSLKRAASGSPIDSKALLGKLVSSALLKRTASTQISDQKTATQAAFDVVSLHKNYDFLAVVKAKHKAPKADDKGFHAGQLRGKLGLFELSSAKLLCATVVSADSSLEAVKKPGQTRQQAAEKDFEMQVRRALEEAFARMTNELVLEIG